MLYLSIPSKRTSVAVPDSSPTDMCIQYRPLHGAVILDVIRLKVLPSFTVKLLKLTRLIPDGKDVERTAQNATQSEVHSTRIIAVDL